MKIRLSLFLLAALLVSDAGMAATAGSDDASQAAYKDGWTNGKNGGTGFTPWNLVMSDTSGTSGFFVGDSKTVAGSAGGDINTSGVSFGIFARGAGHSAEAARSFDSKLAAGQTFSTEIAVNWRNGNKGMDVRDSDGKTIFNFNVGGDTYVVNHATSGTGSVGDDYSNNTVFKLSFAQVGGTGGSWTIERTGAISKTVQGTYGGEAASVKFYNMGTDDGLDNNLLFNKLTVGGAAATTGTAAAKK